MELVKAGAKLDLQDKVELAVLAPQNQILFIDPFIFHSTKNGDSAVIIATVKQEPVILRELVRAGSDLNLQNQVRYTVTVDTAPHIIPSCPY